MLRPMMVHLCRDACTRFDLDTVYPIALPFVDVVVTAPGPVDSPMMATFASTSFFKPIHNTFNALTVIQVANQERIVGIYYGDILKPYRRNQLFIALNQRVSAIFQPNITEIYISFFVLVTCLPQGVPTS